MRNSQDLLRSRLSVTLLFSLATLASCRIEKPATVVPPPPTIESFTASSKSVARDGKVTLSWKSSQATSVELRESSTGVLPVAVDLLEGSFEATITADSLFVLTVRGAGGTDARALSVSLSGDTVGSITFQAIPATIPAGGEATLAWIAPGAVDVSLTATAQPIDVRGQRGSGAVTVAPAFDTTYTLEADGQTRTVSVTVQPAVLTLEASPRAAEVGDAITLSWTAGGAERIIVTSPGRGQLVEITDPARIRAGTFADTVPTLPAGGVLTYEVAAVKGAERLSKQVEVFVGTGLTISRFDAPAVAAAGASYSVRWQTLAADRIELKLDGVVIHQSLSRADTASGAFGFTAPAADFAVELIATNTLGARVSQLAQVDSVGIPTSATLTAAPTTVAAGSPVTLTFASTEARRVRIVDTLGQTVFSVTGQLAEGGTATVYPSADTTYTLTADNQLGNTPVTATAAVTVTGTPLTVTQFPPTAISGQNVQLNTSQAGALFYGFPHNQVLSSTQADFRDIKSTGQQLLQSGGHVTSVDLPFSTWIYGKKQSGLLTVSRAGWIAWGAPLVVTTAETTLPSASAPATIIAPFWDDLTLTANSVVYAQLLGEAPEQSLVVQWDHMQVGTTANTEATFQVRVHQNGVVSFHYKTMNLGSTVYSSFTTGVQNDAKTLGLRSTTTPASNSALYFFSPVSAPLETRVVKGSSYGGLVKVGAATTLVSQLATAYVIPIDLAVTELMFRPAASVTNGQYVEVLNRTAAPLDMSGWQLRSPASTTFSVANGFTLAPGVPTLLGASTDPLENDDAGVSASWSPFVLSPDAGAFTFGTADAGANFTYSGPADGGRGTAVDVDPGPYLTTAGSLGIMACTATATYGSQTPLQFGSPGALRNCFGYAMQSIPVHYVDITPTGTRLINSATSVDDATYTVTLAATAGDPAPVAFGVRRPIVSVSTNGWLVWGTSTSTEYTNRTSPSTTATPFGTVAPFWDDLKSTAGPTSDIYWKRFAASEDPVTTAPHWVFMWHQFRYVVGDDINIELKLFEDGSIEYHYGTMVSGSTTNYANGNSATVWLENPAGNFALPVSITQPLVVPNSALRFVPQ